MDPMYMALSFYRRRRFQQAADICSKLLERNPYDQAAWALKIQALTEQLYVDEVDVDEEGIAETLMDDNSIASLPRPGTSLKRNTGTAGGISPGVRPASQSGRPLSGFVRPGTQSARPGTMDQAIRTPRTSHTARPVSSASGRYVRLGTASMLSTPDGPFINLSRLDMAKYSAKPHLAKSLFEYIFHHENDVRHALELASLATQATQSKDWWWLVQLGKCYYRLGMYRDAEQHFKSALSAQQMIDTHLYLAKVYVRLDQPLAAVQVYQQGISNFPDEVTLLIGQARVFEGLNEMAKAVSLYKSALHQDNTSVEAIACIATHYFYSDQPEIALKFYRRLLQMGVYNAELYNNLGLCCFYAQQYDMILNCFTRALSIATDEQSADVWYNIGHVALGIGDTSLAHQCFRLALAANNNHAEAYNNLGVIEARKGRFEMARAFFQASFNISSFTYEPHYNYAMIADKIGDLQTSYNSVKRALDVYPQHLESKSLLKTLEQHFAMI